MPGKPRPPSLVALSLSRLPRGLPEHVLVLFVPSTDKWNDFGLTLHADVGIRTSSGRFDWVKGFLAFKEQHDSRSIVGELIKQANVEWLAADRVTIPFASMLRNVKAYQQLVRNLGVRGAKRAAVAACDAAFANARTVPLRGWPDFTASVAFKRAFMRFSETAFAYNHAEVIFAGVALDAEDARQDFRAVVTIGNAALTYRFTFAEGGLGASRVAVIIGRNGTGKTASLIAVARSLLDTNARGVVPRPQTIVQSVAGLCTFTIAAAVQECRQQVTSSIPKDL